MPTRIDIYLQLGLAEAERRPELRYNEQRIARVFNSLSDDDRAVVEKGKELGEDRLRQLAVASGIPLPEFEAVLRNFYLFFSRLPKGPVVVKRLADFRLGQVARDPGEDSDSEADT